MAKPRPNYSLLPKTVNGGIAGMCGLLCVFPLDLVKTRLQKQQVGPDGKQMYNSIVDAFRKTYTAEGFFGMYRGMLFPMIFVFPEKGMKLVVNDYARYYLGERYGSLALYRQVLAGASAGLCQGTVTTPMELLKIQMQDAGRVAAQAKLAGKTVKKVSSSELVLNIYQKYGILGMYKGVAPTMLRDISFACFYFPLFATLNDLGPRRIEDPFEAVFWWSFLAGCVAGAVSAVIVTPFDVVKTRIQTISKAETDRTYSGIKDCFMKILKYEGPTALFKGGTCRMMVIAPLHGVAQAVYYLGVAEYLLGYKK